MVWLQGCLPQWSISVGFVFRREPWNGLLIPTDHQFHNDIQKDFQYAVQHPVLKKWLYLPEASEDFESMAMDIVEMIRIGDQRFGVEPKERVKRKSKQL